jgi:hypothetical protein
MVAPDTHISVRDWRRKPPMPLRVEQAEDVPVVD